MAHNLMTGRNGKAAMMFAGETPWHGLGHRVDAAQSAAEAIRLAQLGWTVEPREIFMMEGDGLKMIPGRRAITRTDTGTVFAVMSEDYTPVQNHEGFAFMDSLTRDGALKYNTAGALGDGERVWMLAELPGEMKIEGTADVSHKYLLLANGHDGSLAFHVRATAVRVVCQNTLTAALGTGGGWRNGGSPSGAGGRGIALRHTSNVLNQVETVRKALGLAVRQFDALNKDSNELAAAPCTRDALRDYVATLIPHNPEAASTTRTDAIRETIVRNFTSSPGNDLPGVKGSYWAALNAVTYYADHQRASRGKTDTEARSNRLESAWFGGSADLKDSAYDLALESAGVSPAMASVS